MSVSALIVHPQQSEFSFILDAKDWIELKDRLHVACLRLGAQDFMLRLNVALPGAGQNHLVGSFGAELLQSFARAGGAGDPVDRHFAGSSLPCSWQADGVCQPGPQPSPYAGLSALGLRHGLSVASYGSTLNTRIDFLSAEPLSRVEHQAAFVLLGVHAQEAAATLWRRVAATPAIQLSPREIECLQWSAGGKTSREIGSILGIKERTVYFHLTNVAAKLEVHSTRHAICRAMSLGLLRYAR